MHGSWLWPLLLDSRSVNTGWGRDWGCQGPLGDVEDNQRGPESVTDPPLLFLPVSN